MLQSILRLHRVDRGGEWSDFFPVEGRFGNINVDALQLVAIASGMGLDTPRFKTETQGQAWPCNPVGPSLRGGRGQGPPYRN